MEKARRLNNFILWCKNWYNPINREEDIFVTVKKVLTLDDYFYMKDNHDVILVINNVIDYLLHKNPKIFNNQQLSLSVLFNDIVKYRRSAHIDIDRSHVLLRYETCLGRVHEVHEASACHDKKYEGKPSALEHEDDYLAVFCDQ